jgi:hypothetical protein
MKALDPYYCPGSKGGNRKFIFKDYELSLLKTVLLAYLEENPQQIRNQSDNISYWSFPGILILYQFISFY